MRVAVIVPMALCMAGAGTALAWAADPPATAVATASSVEVGLPKGCGHAQHVAAPDVDPG